MIRITKDFASELRRTIEDQRLVGSSEAITLVSENRDTDPLVAEQALWSKSIAELSTGRTIHFARLGKIDAAVTFVELAVGTSLQAKAFDRICNAITDAWAVSFQEDDFASLSPRLPLNLLSKIKESIAKREAEIRSFHSTSANVNFVTNYRSIYKNILEKGKKLFVLNGSMGSKKTQALREIYSQAREEGQFPIMITGKRSIAANFFSGDHADHYQNVSSEDPRGLFGVINTIVCNKHHSDRARCKVVIIDEVEDLFDHTATGTLGTTFADRVAAMDRLEDLISRADKVVIADAMITDRSIAILSKMAGQQAHIFKADGTNDVTIKVGKESEVIALARKDMQEGKKVALFCDYRVERFVEIAHAIREGSGKDLVELTSEYLKTQGKSLSEIESILEASDAAIISPVINAGASIELEAYDRVYVLAGRTLAPTAILQSVRRFRCAKTAYLALRGGQSESRITDPKSIIFDAVKRDADSPIETMTALFDRDNGRFLAEHAAARNGQFTGFKQTLLIAAEQMGFKVEQTRLTTAQRKTGTKAKAVGRRKTEEIRKEVAFETSNKRHAGVIAERDFGTDESRTFTQETALRTSVAMDLLNIKKLDDETYEEIFGLDIDHIVLRRKLIDKSSDCDRRSQIAYNVAARFLDASGFSFISPTESVITKEKVEKAFESLNQPVTLETGAEISGLALIKMAFPAVDFGKKYRTQIVKKVVRALGYDWMKIGTQDRVALYGIAALITNGINVTEIADRHITPRPDVRGTTVTALKAIPFTKEKISLQQQFHRYGLNALVSPYWLNDALQSS